MGWIRKGFEMTSKRITIAVAILAVVVWTCGMATASTVNMEIKDVIVSGYNGAISPFSGTLSLSGGSNSSLIGIDSPSDFAALTVTGTFDIFFNFVKGGSITVLDGVGGEYKASVIPYSGTISGPNSPGLTVTAGTRDGSFNSTQFAGLNVSAATDLLGNAWDFFITSPGDSVTTLMVTVNDPGANNGAHAPTPSALLSGLALFGLVGLCRMRKR